MVTLDRVEFSGLEVVPAAALDSAWRGDVGAAVPVARLCEIRDRAATILRGLGYLAAVQIPPQRIDKGGTVHMDVLMARLT
ncbi:POTRA domain-containing protein, partial [Klebsiella pneumoniae]|uniref:POTRA domain-containing protein n=3 Tax=Bacteria TaxID=2 RepID=UPI003D093941